ncbi:MAG TPA: hypothetical protein PLP34_01885 [Chitinophagaceae bacterium]|nr:hypothetical protein [Chitinophagaceae bacterium]
MYKSLGLFALILGFSLPLIAGKKYSIAPKETITSSSSQFISKKGDAGGSFRLVEYIPEHMKIGMTELVTFHLHALQSEQLVFNLNCAKPLSLRYVFHDAGSRHSFQGNIEKKYRIENVPCDLSSFKNGPCTLTFYNTSNELLFTYTFEKTEN